MNAEDIDSSFRELMAMRAVGKSIGITNNHVAQLRYKLANNIGISTDFKIKLLQRSGWRQNDKTFTQKDLIDAVKLALKSSHAAKDLGAEYLVEKYLKTKQL